MSVVQFRVTLTADGETFVADVTASVLPNGDVQIESLTENDQPVAATLAQLDFIRAAALSIL